MEAKDLRIGNCVIYGSTICTINSIIEQQEKGYYLTTNKIDKYIGDFTQIPLTEEWLDDDKFSIEWHCENEYTYRGFSFTVTKEGVICNDVDVLIEHVHTFQNFIHALTGEELTIKE